MSVIHWKQFKSILRKRVWWAGIAKDRENCTGCRKLNRVLLVLLIVDNRSLLPTVWEIITLDFNGPYQKFGNILILFVIDLRSRFVIARPVKSTSFEHAKALLDSIFEMEGFRKQLNRTMGLHLVGKSMLATVPNEVSQLYVRLLFSHSKTAW